MRKLNTAIPTYIDYRSMGELMEKLDSISDDVTMPWNSVGGLTGAGQMFANYLGDRENKTNVDVAGLVASMGVFMLPYFDNVTGANQSDLMIHSVEGGEDSTQNHTNEFLYKSALKKIDDVRFKEVTGKSLRQVMLPKDGERFDVWITGKQAAYIGFFDSSYDLVDKTASLKTKVDLSNLEYDLPENIKHKYGLINKNVNNNDKEMEITDVTITKLKEGNSEVFNAILKLGGDAKAAKVTKVMKYAKYDMDKAAEIIKSDEELSTDDVEHFMEKKHSGEKLAALEDDSEDPLNPAKPPKKATPEKPDEKQAALNDLDKDLNPELHKS